MENSRCRNLAAVTEIDCSIMGRFKDRLVLICCFCGKPKSEKTQIYRKKYTTTFNISHSRAILERNQSQQRKSSKLAPFDSLEESVVAMSPRENISRLRDRI